MSNIASGNTIAEVAHLIGDVARANMLAALMGGQALTAGELANIAGVTPQTTSGHLAKMTDARLLAVEKQGRHRYFRIATPEVAHAVHALTAVAASGPKRHRPVGPKDEALRLARTCYDHLAGRLAVALADALVSNGAVVLEDGTGLVTDEGRRLFCDFGLDLKQPAASGRPLCRTCLDWSERRSHLAGRLGAGLLARAFDLGWVKRMPDSRALHLTPEGNAGFIRHFALPDNWQAPRDL